MASVPGTLASLISSCEQIASCIQTRESEAVIAEVLGQTMKACQSANTHQQTAEIKTIVSQLDVAVGTWKKVWPHLGHQEEFRNAVAREAKSWAKRLVPLAKES